MPSNNPLPDGGGGGGGVTDHGALTGLADDDHTQYSLISAGSGAPVTTPSRTGLIYINTASAHVYISTGTSSSADWTRCDGSGGGTSNHSALSNLGADDHTQYSLISSQAGVPSSTPSRVGLVNIDTTNDTAYISTDTAGSGGWTLVSNLPQGITSVSEDTSPTLGGNLDGGGFAITNIGNVDGRDVSADGTKLDGIESGATADQTGAEIKVAYEAEADTNAYTDAEKTKLAGISAGAEVNAVDSVNTQTGAVVLDADDIDDSATAHRFATAAQLTKLDGIESGATADQTGAEIKAAYEAEADTNAFTDADHTKLDGIEASATANPRTALSIFEATLSSATQNCNGTQGSTFDFTWTASVNNGTYITSFTNGNSAITLTEAGEYLVDAQIIVLNSALSGRMIFTGQIIHQDSTPTTLWDQTLGAPYIRDQAANYDSGGLGGQQTIFASAGDRIILRRTVLDTANSASNVYASQTDTKIRIQKID